MKQLLLILGIIILYSCTSNIKESSLNAKFKGQNVTIIEIDSCEYIMFYNNMSSTTHKGNCKYCKSRLEKLLNQKH
jgi:hypothetical protein